MKQNGEYMFKNGVLTHDVFSWIIKGKYWMSHEWLFEVIIYSLKNVFGKIHPIIYMFLCLGSLFSILFFTNKKNITKNIPYTLLYLMFLVIVFMTYIQARPHLMSFSFIALTIYFLYDLYKNENSKKLYFLPLVTILWSNVHGGSSNLSYLLCLIFLIFGLFKFSFKKIEANRLSKKQILKYLIVMVLCMISVCINIHGFKMFIYPYENMMDSVMLNNISEWQPTNLNNAFHYVYFVFILFVVMTMLLSEKKINFMDFILFGFCFYLGLKSIRFWTYSPIIMYYIVFNYVKERKPDECTNLILGVFSVLLVVGFACCSPMLFNVKYNNLLDSKVINIIKQENPKRLFNMYDYGGELVYNDIPVFIDGRADLYSKHNYKDYLNISNCSGDYAKLIDKYEFDYLLLSKKYPIYYSIKNSEGYELIYQNKNLALYKKTVN